VYELYYNDEVDRKDNPDLTRNLDAYQAVVEQYFANTFERRCRATITRSRISSLRWKTPPRVDGL